MKTPAQQIAEDNNDLHVLILRLIGMFSHIQDVVDKHAAKYFLESRMPKTGDFFMKKAVNNNRLRDEDRIDLFKAIAADLGTDADLELFRPTYKRVAQLRNDLAHSARIDADGPDRMIISRTQFFTETKSGDPSIQIMALPRDGIRQAIRDCGWLEAQMLYVLVSSGLMMSVNRNTGAEYTIIKPTRRPEDWDGELYLAP